MGFLIFAFRKLTLKKRINQKQFRQMNLSAKQQKIEEQISIMQQAKTSTQNALQMMMQGASSMAGSLFQNEMSGYQNAYTDKSKAYSEALKNANNDSSNELVINAKAELDKAQNKGMEQYQVSFSKYQTAQQSLAAANNVMNSIFSASDQAELNYLHTQDTAITQEMTSNESQLKQLEAEYSEVEKGEDQEAKRCAPKFGMMG